MENINNLDNLLEFLNVNLEEEIKINSTAQPLVSVIVPCYNSEKTIMKSIDSLLQQSYKNTEIIIINDGSNDKTSEISLGLSKKYENIFYYYQDNKGVAAARNFGINKANGKYIKFLDSDDLLLKNSISLLVNKIEEDKKNKLVFGNYLIVDQKENNFSFDYRFKKEVKISNKSDLLNQQIIDNLIGTGSVLVAKEVFSNLIFDENISGPEDFDLWNRIIFKHKVSYIHKPIYLYIIDNSEQITNNLGKQLIYTDLVCKKLFSNLNINNLFRNNDLNKFINSCLKRPDTPYSFLLDLIFNLKNRYEENYNNLKNKIINENNDKNLSNLVYYFTEDYKEIEIKSTFDHYLKSLKKKLHYSLFFKRDESEEYIFRNFYQQHFFVSVRLSNNQFYKILYLDLPLGNLPKTWVNYFNLNIDQIWVSNKTFLDNYSDNGIDINKIIIMPNNCIVIENDNKPLKEEKREKNKTTFLCYSDITNDQGIEKIILAFNNYSKDKNVELIIKTDNIYNYEEYKKLKELSKRSKKINFIDKKYSKPEVLNLYKKTDFFIFINELSNSDDKCLIASQYNIPIITNYRDSNFYDKENSFIINSKIVSKKNYSIPNYNTKYSQKNYLINQEDIINTLEKISPDKEKMELINQNTKIMSSEKYIKKKIEKALSKLTKAPSVNNLNELNKFLDKKYYEYLKKKKYHKAIEILQRLIKLNKNNNNYYYKLGEVNLLTNNYQLAIDNFTICLKNGLSNDDLYLKMAECLFKTGNDKIAKVFQDKASNNLP